MPFRTEYYCPGCGKPVTAIQAVGEGPKSLPCHDCEVIWHFYAAPMTGGLSPVSRSRSRVGLPGRAPRARGTARREFRIHPRQR